MYRGKYFIAFYDSKGEEFINCFDSITQILYYLKKPINQEEIRKIRYSVYMAVKYDRTVKFLDGKPRKIYLIEI